MSTPQKINMTPDGFVQWSSYTLSGGILLLPLGQVSEETGRLHDILTQDEGVHVPAQGSGRWKYR